MTILLDQDITQQRLAKWRIDLERPVRTLEDARALLGAVGFCLFHPAQPPVTAPTFIAAYFGSEEAVRDKARAAAGPRAGQAIDLMVRLLREREAFAVPYGPGNGLLVSPAEFPYMYALIGERNPKKGPGPGARGEKLLMKHAFELLEKAPATALELSGRLGKGVTEEAVERSLTELWATLRVLRSDFNHDQGVVWEVALRLAPEQVRIGLKMSTGEALSALVSRYLETVIAAGQREIEDFFSPLVAKSKVAEVIRALAAARELEQVKIGARQMLRLPERVKPGPRLQQRLRRTS